MEVKNKISVFSFSLGNQRFFFDLPFPQTHGIILSSTLLIIFVFILFAISKDFNSIRKGSLDTLLSFYTWEILLFILCLKKVLKTQETPPSDQLFSKDLSMLKVRLLQSPQPLHPSPCPRMMTQLLMTQSHMGFSTAPVPFDSL